MHKSKLDQRRVIPDWRMERTKEETDKLWMRYAEQEKLKKMAKVRGLGEEGKDFLVVNAGGQPGVFVPKEPKDKDKSGSEHGNNDAASVVAKY